LNHTLKSLIVAAVAVFGAAAAQAQSWTLYDYSATLNAATTIGGTTFAAGSQVSGAVYALNGVTPGNGGWGFAGEVARYGDAVNSFSFQHALLNVTGTGAGDLGVDNNRRLTKRGTAYQDVFLANLNTEPTTVFTPTAFGGGVKSLGFELRSSFQGSGPAATTSLAMPSAVNLPLFNGSNSLLLTFNDNSSLNATLQTMTVSQVDHISAVPEPGSAAMAGIGMAALMLLRSRRQRQA
jgi:hypothetical protein